jgi:two-component system, NarL family, response regulator LiaR
MADPIRILIVDDHPLVREGMRSLLSGYTDFIIVGTVASGEMAVSAYASLKPDVVLMDVNLPDISGLDALKRIRQLDSQARVLLLTSYTEEMKVQIALDHGAMGYLVKNAEISELVRAIKAAFHGKHTLSPEAVKSLIQHRPKPTPSGETMTQRELEVLALLLRGRTNNDIAHELSISVSTTKAYMAKIYKKLHVQTRAQAIAKAVELQLLPR